MHLADPGLRQIQRLPDLAHCHALVVIKRNSLVHPITAIAYDRRNYFEQNPTSVVGLK